MYSGDGLEEKWELGEYIHCYFFLGRIDIACFVGVCGALAPEQYVDEGWCRLGACYKAFRAEDSCRKIDMS